MFYMEHSEYGTTQTSLANLMTLFSVLGGGMLIAWTLVGYIIRHDTAETDSEDEEYERSYYEEFEALEEKDHTTDYLELLGNKWVHEDTPCGVVIMTYKAAHESFWYYADRRSVPYRILDTVARRFAIENDCKSVCVNYKEEFEKGKAEAIAAKTVGKEGSDAQIPRKPEKRSPFATFKSYNMKKGRTTSKKYIITENANRFTNKGPVSEWIDPNAESEESEQDTRRDLTYAAFRRTQKVWEQAVPDSVRDEIIRTRRGVKNEGSEQHPLDCRCGVEGSDSEMQKDD